MPWKRYGKAAVKENTCLQRRPSVGRPTFSRLSNTYIHHGCPVGWFVNELPRSVSPYIASIIVASKVKIDQVKWQPVVTVQCRINLDAMANFRKWPKLLAPTSRKYPKMVSQYMGVLYFWLELDLQDIPVLDVNIYLPLL